MIGGLGDESCGGGVALGGESEVRGEQGEYEQDNSLGNVSSQLVD